ncbi:hypothetical protein BJY04DRAFT_43612 [Aspergillus karnatakaensis]|uniref:uncharacterized protein n=1 Tax=Aspergillus karnatakaensis TaxID=1810916 RepID=UPI003CCCC0F9
MTDECFWRSRFTWTVGFSYPLLRSNKTGPINEDSAHIHGQPAIPRYQSPRVKSRSHRSTLNMELLRNASTNGNLNFIILCVGICIFEGRSDASIWPILGSEHSIQRCVVAMAGRLATVQFFSAWSSYSTALQPPSMKLQSINQHSFVLIMGQRLT